MFPLEVTIYTFTLSENVLFTKFLSNISLGSIPTIAPLIFPFIINGLEYTVSSSYSNLFSISLLTWLPPDMAFLKYSLSPTYTLVISCIYIPIHTHYAYVLK